MILTVKDAAKRTGLTRDGIYYFIYTQRLPASRLLGQYVFTEEDLDKFIQVRGAGFPHPGRPKKQQTALSDSVETENG